MGPPKSRRGFDPTLWHTLSNETIFAHLKSTPTGLTGAEAAQRLAEYGPNELQAAHRISPWTIFFEQFKNILIVILLVATALSAFLGHGIEAIAIAVIVLFAVLLGFAQEYRAERATEALRQMAAPTATALRDREEVEIPARALVPGDVVLLRAGDTIPADVRLIEAVNLHIEEAALTGESVPVDKHAAPLTNGELTLGDRKNLAYAGTAATYGRGRAVVVATGMNTEFGKIAQMLQTVETGRTPLQTNLDKVGRVLAWAALVVVAAIVVLGLYRGQPFIEMLMFGIALAVAVVPEALPAVVTISLAIGVQRMVKRHALMRRLQAVETLGSTSVICSDKTGTLTKDEMTVRKICVAGQMLDVSGAGYEPHGRFSREDLTIEPSSPLKLLLRAAALASDAHIVHSEANGRWHVKGDPTEGALVVVAGKAGLNKAELESQFPRVDEIPFTSETKRMTTLHSEPEGVVAYAKGAPEIILDSCVRHMTADGVTALDAESREMIAEAARRMASEALRVLAVASKPRATRENAERDMTFLGLVGMIDPPRPEAKTAIETCEQAGIKPIMITGDHPLTAQAVARELGLLKTGRVVTGAELEAMSEAEFEREVENIDVYARVSPAHKLRVVTALQKKGHIAAMTGDGVNDAPALKKADIGIAMGITGTDVTKEAAAMTLTDDNFASIVAAVEEGRGIFDNIKKFVLYLLSCNVAEIAIIFISALAGWAPPLTAIQLLWLNLLTDGAPALALATEKGDPDIMQQQPRPKREPIINRLMILRIAVMTVALTAVVLTAYQIGLRTSLPLAETMAFVTLALSELPIAYTSRSERYPLYRLGFFTNKWMQRAVLLSLALILAVVFVPFLNEPFNTVPLALEQWLIVLPLAFIPATVAEIAKFFVRRSEKHEA